MTQDMTGSAADASGMTGRIAFLTIGQTPRVDLVPAIVEQLEGVTYEEFGALDGLSRAEIADFAPGPDDTTLCTRLASGEEVVIGKSRTGARLQEILHRIDGRDFDIAVLLCTSTFPGLVARVPLLGAQDVVDRHAEALLEQGAVGLVLPLESQVAEWRRAGAAEKFSRATYFSPYAGERLAAAAAELDSCDFVVMHCMGYDRDMKRRMMDILRKPVFVAREIVASAVRTALH